MALIPVPEGQLATIVTSLEMREKPRPRPMALSPFRLVHWPAPASDRYRALFRRIGAPWLWFSRLVAPEADLRQILDDPLVLVYAATDRAGIEVGMLELDFRTPGTCALSYLGLIPELTGKGHGGWLMANALALAWRKGIERVVVHTCTLDHASALAVYLRYGFTPYKRSIEMFADPRLAGVLPPETAPQIPLLGATRE